MKRYHELTHMQQRKAFDKCTAALLNDISEGMRFNDALNGDNLQARIDRAFKDAELMRTPWFVGEYIMDTCREDIEGMAQCTAEDALYSEGEIVIAGIITPV
jgi:hypothetical protein